MILPWEESLKMDQEPTVTVALGRTRKHLVDCMLHGALLVLTPYVLKLKFRKSTADFSLNILDIHHYTTGWGGLFLPGFLCPIQQAMQPLSKHQLKRSEASRAIRKYFWQSRGPMGTAVLSFKRFYPTLFIGSFWSSDWTAPPDHQFGHQNGKKRRGSV